MNSPLYQKNAVFYGDSLCYARGERGDSQEDAVIRRSGYPGRIATKYEMGLNVYAYSGQSISNVKYGLYKHMEKRIVTIPAEERAKVDYVILEGGVNDIGNNAPMGEWSDDVASLDTDTFTGAVQRYILLAKEMYPNAKFGFIITYRMPIAEHWYNDEPIPEIRDLENAENYFNRIIQICEAYGVKVLDLFHDDEFCNEIFKVTTTTRQDKAANMASDGVHITSHGYDTIAPVIAAWMETI